MARARRQAAVPARDFWVGTALGYRARQRELRGHPWAAVKDARAMHDAYRRVLAADSACTDCYLGLGVYQYGLARASALARFVARLIGLGTGDVATAMRYLRRVAHDGDLAQVEGTWVLAAALVREAARDPGGKPVLEREARGYVDRLAARYPGNPVVQRFLTEVPARGPTARDSPTRRPVRPALPCCMRSPRARSSARSASCSATGCSS